MGGCIRPVLILREGQHRGARLLWQDVGPTDTMALIAAEPPSSDRDEKTLDPTVRTFFRGTPVSTAEQPVDTKTEQPC